tara:strand:+ start:3391 stop:4743 length:1353 start_codon:yes stop_codon:yes gene_type:complete
MATKVTRYIVSGLATGAADGTSLTDAWPTFTAANAGLDLAYPSGLIVADVQVDILFSNPNSIDDSTAQVTLDSISDVTRYPSFIHSGANDYVLVPSSVNNHWLIAGTANAGVPYFELHGGGKLNMTRGFTASSGNTRGIFRPQRASALIDGVKARGLNGNTGSGFIRAIEQKNYSNTVKVSNCVFADFEDAGWAALRGNCDSYNNVYINSPEGIKEDETGVLTSRNDIFQSCTVDISAGGADVNYRLSDNAVVWGANDVLSTTLTFVDAANLDYHLAAGDTAAQGVGVGPSVDADVPATDAEGTARSGATTDIGAYILAATASTASRNVTNVAAGAVQTFQVMEAGVNKTAGEGLGGSDLVLIENNHQVTVPSAVSGVTLTIDPDTLDYTVTKAQLPAGSSITFDAFYYSPSTEKSSKIAVTITAPQIPTGSGKPILKPVTSPILSTLLN